MTKKNYFPVMSAKAARRCSLLGISLLAIVMMSACNTKTNESQSDNQQITTKMDFLELTRQRYSERFFDSTKMVEQEKIDRILEAARLSPTAANKQPQRLYVLKSKEALQKAQSASFSSLYGAPVVILLCYDLDSVWHNQHETLLPDYNSGEQDCGIVATQMMYAAEEQGVHTIWIRGFDAGALQRVFELPANMIPAMMLPIGYPSANSAPSPKHFERKALEEIVTEL
ncbi:MAG: nitroreductase family protein [Bacteroidales bacterium]|nr:nitroreductase family protein [Bacteroidales bacterium]